MNTIRTKTKGFPFVWMLGVALVLLGLSLPALIVRFSFLPGEEGRLALLSGKNVDQEALVRLERSRLWAGSAVPGLVGDDLAMLLTFGAQRVKPEAAREFLQQAEEWQRAALAVFPADTYGWQRLAFLSYKRTGPSFSAAQAWSLSLATAPYEPRLLWARLEMGLVLDPFLNPEMRRQRETLIQTLAIRAPQALAEKARKGNFVSLVESALEKDPRAAEAFQAALAAQRGQKN